MRQQTAIKKAKKLAEEAGLELFYEHQWRSWCLAKKGCYTKSTSLWLSSNQLHVYVTEERFGELVDEVLAK